MEQGLKHWRLIVAAALLLGGAAEIALAQTGTPQPPKTQEQQLQELMDGILKNIPDGSEKQPTDNSAQLQELMKALTRSDGAAGDGPKTEQSMAEACLLPTVLPNPAAKTDKAENPEDEAKARELEAHYSSLPQLMFKKDWPAAVDTARKALDLEKTIKVWPLSAPRELYRGELWSNLGSAYFGLPRGDRAENIENAIEAQKNAFAAYREGLSSGALNPECSFMVATILGNLGNAYGKRILGEKAENGELAIATFDEALRTLTQDVSPQLWAAIQNNLASVYSDRVRGSRAANIERAIAALEATQQLWTREAFPAAWATIQSNLAGLYLTRVNGNKAENIEKAIEAVANSLTVRSREMPSGEKPIENPLAGLQDKIEKNIDPLGIGGLGKSISDAMEVALNAEKKGAAAMIVMPPDGWAQSQNNYGEAYLDRIKGDRADNIERAIAAYEAALTLWTREAYPAAWARAQTNLGEALAKRVRGDRKGNLDRAIGTYRAALAIHTTQAFPRDHLLTARLLGQALMAKGDWRGALEAFEAARTSFRVLFGQGLNEAEARDVVQEAGPLFTEAAYAAAELGDGKQALALLEEGKARLLAVALKLEGLSLAPAQRQRLDALRVQIREGEAAYQAAYGEEKAAKIAALGGLRQELLKLVDAAEAAKKPGAGRDIVAIAADSLPENGALVAPVVAEAGGRIILVVRNQSGAHLTVVGLPQLTSARLGALLGARDQGGWLGAYNINYLSPEEQADRQIDWFGGIETVAAELGQVLGRPLVQALAAQGLAPGKGAPVTILPVGALGLLPLGLAQHPETKRYLMEDYTVTFAPSLEALASAKARAGAAKEKPSLAAVVNPTQDLPFTALEGALIESRFTPDRRLAVAENAATREAVLAALKGRDYWHFSSHGYFDWDDPRASGLWLAGQIPLTVGDLLEVRALGAPRLAVLSACETGLYDIAMTPNEFTGLPAAFLQLGAGGVLATLWPVSDLSTALLMAKFYDFHRGGGLAPAAALWKAQDWLRHASGQDLKGYLQSAVDAGRLTKQLTGSLDELTRGARPGRSNAARNTGNAATTPGDAPAGAPFAHPYYWSGFTLTGL
jgi:CHAT domain-containing protein